MVIYFGYYGFGQFDRLGGDVLGFAFIIHPPFEQTVESLLCWEAEIIENIVKKISNWIW